MSYARPQGGWLVLIVGATLVAITLITMLARACELFGLAMPKLLERKIADLSPLTQPDGRASSQ